MMIGLLDRGADAGKAQQSGEMFGSFAPQYFSFFVLPYFSVFAHSFLDAVLSCTFQLHSPERR